VRPSRYGDGECLCPRDENVVVEKLLSYHPRAQDKIGCGLDAIMVSQPATSNSSTILFTTRVLVVIGFLLKTWNTCHVLVAPHKKIQNDLMIR
jgi:hypothetical protein